MLLTTPPDDHHCDDVDKKHLTGHYENNNDKHEQQHQHQEDNEVKEEPHQQEKNQGKNQENLDRINNDENDVDTSMPTENDSSNIIHDIPTPISDVSSIILNDNNNNNNNNNNSHDLYRIALFYCYIRISNCNDMIIFHHEILSQSLSTPIHGRIRISKEGINGILSGKYDDLYQYEQQLRIKLSSLSIPPPPQQQQQQQDSSSSCSSNVDSNDQTTHNNDDNNVINRSDYELDVKYCLLRHDITIELQLFHDLTIQETKQVVNLVDTDISLEEDDNNKKNQNKKGSYSSRRRQQKRQQKKMKKTTKNNQINQQQNLEHSNKDDECHQEAADNEYSNNNIHHNDDATTTNSSISPNHHVIDIKDIFHKTLQREHDIKQQNCHHLSPYEWNQYIQQLSSSSSSPINTTTATKNVNNDNTTTTSSSVCDDGQEKPKENNNRIILLDCRNVYESNIGYMKGYDNDSTTSTTTNNNNNVVTTLCTNTRKFQELPEVLVNESDTLMNASHIFMYCTGGVRCERASTFLHTLLEEKIKLKQEQQTPHTTNDEKNDNDTISNMDTTPTTTTAINNIPKIYQLHGGIQRYIESDYNDLFYGKNFVFDPRRTDPIVGGGGSARNSTSSDGEKLTAAAAAATTESSTTTNDVDDNDDTKDLEMISNTCQSPCDNNITSNNINMKTTNSVIVGRCVVCNIEHDDYDNGYAPSMNYEARCYKCRILVLVCNACRKKVQCWNYNNNNTDSTITMATTLPKLYCGGIEPNHQCLHCPPVRAIT